jgi:tetratricopeptide (TPR) repeat protein/O-antigen ligase
VRYPQFVRAITGYSSRRILMFLFCGIIPFYLAAAFDEKFVKKIQYTVIAAGSVASIYAILQILQLDFIWHNTVKPYGQRSISTFGNPNFFSAYILIVIFWVIGDLFDKKNIKLWFLVLLINITGLAITMTRSSFMGLFFGIIILGYLIIYRLKNVIFNQLKKIFYIIISGMILLAVVLSAMSPQFSERIRAITNVKSMGSALTQRLLIWESSYDMLKDTPVVGRGWGNFEIFYPFYQGKLLHKPLYRTLRTHANNTHNFLLELLTQVGIIGTGIYIWLIVMFVYCSLKIYAKTEEKQKIKILLLMTAGVSFWVDNILNVSLFFPMPALAFWLNAGILAWNGRKIINYPVRKFHLGNKYNLFLTGMIVFVSFVVFYNYMYFASSMHFFKGFKFSRQNRLVEAKEELLKCYQMYPFNVDNNYELGNVYARFKQKNADNMGKAIWAYEESIKANPGYDEIYFNLGIMHMRQNEIDKALHNMKVSLDINPTSPGVQRSIGDIMGQQKKYDEAIKYYEDAIAIDSEDETLWNNCGYYYERKGNVKKANEYYQKALKINPSFKPALANFNKIRKNYGNSIPASKINGMFNEADIFINKKDWPAALKVVEKILEIDPVNLRALLYRGNIIFKLGKLNEAKKIYNTILSIYPDNATARSNLEVLNRYIKK